jgi:hypothetical protein
MDDTHAKVGADDAGADAAGAGSASERVWNHTHTRTHAYARTHTHTHTHTHGHARQTKCDCRAPCARRCPALHTPMTRTRARPHTHARAHTHNHTRTHTHTPTHTDDKRAQTHTARAAVCRPTCSTCVRMPVLMMPVLDPVLAALHRKRCGATHARTHTHAHTHTHNHTRTHTHTPTHARTRAHTQATPRAAVCRPPRSTSSWSTRLRMVPVLMMPVLQKALQRQPCGPTHTHASAHARTHSRGTRI